MNADAVNPLIDEFERLVDTSRTERNVQRYVERYPWLLDAFHGCHIDPPFVISQFPLGADHRADFAYSTWGSRGTFLHLVEIESPRLRIFNSKDEFTPDFNHALQQLEDWTAWCNRNQQHLNMILDPLMAFRDGWMRSQGINPTRHFYVSTTLIAGRREHLSNPRRQQRWEHRVNSFHGTVRTYDGLIELNRSTHYHRQDSARERLRCVKYKSQQYFLKQLGRPLWQEFNDNQ